MDSNVVEPTLLDPLDLYHTDTGVGQQALWSSDTPDSPFTFGGWDFHRRRRATIATYQVSEYLPPTEEVNRSRLFGPRHRSQSRHEPVMSYAECSNDTQEGSLVPSELYFGDPWLPEETTPSVGVWRYLSTGGGKEVFDGGPRNTHEDVRVTAGPSRTTETYSTPEYTSILQRPPAQSQGFLFNPSEPSLDSFDERSVDPSQNFLSPDDPPVSSEYLVPQFWSELQQSSAPVKPIHQGRGLAHPRIASSSLNVRTLPSVQASRIYRSFDDPCVSGFLHGSSEHLTPSVHSTRSRRRTSTPDLSADGFHDTTNKQGVYDSQMNPVEPRKRRAFSATEREETRKVRDKGVCGPCKKRKRRCSIQHVSQKRDADHPKDGKRKRKGSMRRSHSVSLLIPSVKANTGSNKPNPLPLRGGGDIGNKLSGLSLALHDPRRLQAQADVNSASNPGTATSNNPKDAGNSPAFYTNELSNEAVTRASFLSEADASAQLSRDVYSEYGHSFTQSNQGLSYSENCTPFTPMDIERVQGWSNVVTDETGLNKAPDDIDEQTINWMEGLGPLSCDLDFSSAGTNLDR